MDLSILIINWKSAHYLKACLTSLYRETKGIEFEVVVVDNASYDGCAELIKNEFPQAIFVQSGENLGFIRGNNVAFRHATGRNLLLLNPDTEVIGDAVTTMHSLLDSLPKAGVVGCCHVDPDGSVQHVCIQAFPTIVNQILDSNYLKRISPMSSLWGMRPLFDGSEAPAEVQMVSGACLMVKKNVFEEVGLLSLDYLMYADDFDLCYKVKKAGYKVYFTKRARIIHHGAKSTASWKESLSEVWKKDSTHKFICKTRGQLYGNLYKVTMAVVALIRLAIVIIAKPFVRNDSQRKRLAFAFTKWKRILQWAVGLKQWAKSAGEQLGFAASEW